MSTATYFAGAFTAMAIELILMQAGIVDTDVISITVTSASLSIGLVNFAEILSER